MKMGEEIAMSTYTCRNCVGGSLITEFDGGEMIRGYIVSGYGCECGALACLHRDVLRAARSAGHVGDGWSFDGRTWIEPLPAGT
jgi:hypothetical protein